MRLVNHAGLELIKKSENDNDPKAGYVLRNGVAIYYPYIDPVGVCTIGFGSIIYENGKKVTMQDPPISEERAFELLEYELHEKAESIENFLTKNKLILNDNQFSALCSLAYNCGVGAVTNMDASMRSALIQKDNAKIRKAFGLWTKGWVEKKIFGFKRKVFEDLPGLIERRKREVALYFS